MPETQTETHRHAHALAKELGLTREERIELAEMLLKRDCQSWVGLREDELRRLVDAMRGVEYIGTLYAQRPPV